MLSSTGWPIAVNNNNKLKEKVITCTMLTICHSKQKTISNSDIRAHNSRLRSSSPECTCLSSQLLWSQIKNPCSQWAVNISLTSPSTHSQAARMFVWVCTAQNWHTSHTLITCGDAIPLPQPAKRQERGLKHTPSVCQSDCCLSCLCPDMIFFDYNL